MAKSKQAGKNFGTPLKARFDYERELLFEKEFGVAFDFYVSEAMNDGINFEKFALKQYQLHTGNKVREVGAWWNEWFLASPDAGVSEKPHKVENGIAEVKVVRENKMMEILQEGEPTEEWWIQIQGQLFASGKKWCDFIVLNLLTKRIIVVRVFPDKEFFKEIEKAVQEPKFTKELYDKKKVKMFEITEDPEIIEEGMSAIKAGIDVNNLGF